MAANTEIIEAWFTLMAEAMKGGQGAQEALRSLSKVTDPADLSRWMTIFMPGLASSAHQQAGVLEEWLEEWWRMMGVVPRARYLELLEKHDALRRQLEKAQETIRSMEEAFGHKGQQEAYAKNVLDLWSTMLDETLKAQAEWLKTWKGTGEKKEQPAGQADEGEGEKKA